ncbi:HTH-type transcriptional repressor Bm3R1 [Paenibacillus konkukensis]|uniref:HTH-type transcriptional repressor Bm3R1 n=1 Tax=Paenibacillus konkukensis TaxID=2020716 RepID=A0ABY4RQ00_9BACL|nr:TetR/AcrR family transcriptional regulator [Paenibacillus konkukensis]UQZ83474.1 HTH-type transcriptional repressor Bm3R1 [Paenibacillus konkukensis]
MEATISKRDKIAEAALVLFAERGYDGTTVPMIADKAEVGAGTIYRYFESKEVLVNVLFQEGVARLHESVMRGYPSSGTIREQFRHIFYGMVGFAKEHIHELYFIETHSNARYLDDLSRDRFQQLLDFLHSYADGGKEQGWIRPLPADALIGIVFGAFTKIFTLIRAGKLAETPELLAQIEESCWDAVRIHHP